MHWKGRRSIIRLAVGHLSTDVEVIHCFGAHECKLHVCVGVDTARHYKHIRRIDDLNSCWDFQIASNVCNFSIFNVDVTHKRQIFVHNLSSFNQNSCSSVHLSQ